MSYWRFYLLKKKNKKFRLQLGNLKINTLFVIFLIFCTAHQSSNFCEKTERTKKPPTDTLVMIKLKYSQKLSYSSSFFYLWYKFLSNLGAKFPSRSCLSDFGHIQIFQKSCTLPHSIIRQNALCIIFKNQNARKKFATEYSPVIVEI